jgi:type IV secretion system protein VirB9
MRTSSIKYVCYAFLIASNVPYVYALQNTIPSKKDSHIRFVEYDPLNVVYLNVYKAFATEIVFEEDENLVNIIYGLKDNWSDHYSNNRLYIKPKNRTIASSNIIVMTNKRRYIIVANVCKSTCKDSVYSLVYTYKNAAYKDVKQTKKQQEQIEQDVAKSILSKPNNVEIKNYQYTAQGNQDLRPIDAWDNGKFTYLSIAKYKSIPVVYIVKEDGTQTLSNSHVENKNTLVIHQLAKAFVLRSGKQVLLVHNEKFGKQAIFDDTKTTSSLVERVSSIEKKEVGYGN